MINRHVTIALREALADTPVVLLHGARQSGKSTLVRELMEKERGAQYITFDDEIVLATARDNPMGFVTGLKGAVALDEVQKVPQIFPSLKLVVDRDRQPGRFLLTGSANVLLLPQLSESLVGRMEMHTLWPLSQGEIEDRNDNLIDLLFGDESLPRPESQIETSPNLLTSEGITITSKGLVERILQGGYPEIVAGRSSQPRRGLWFKSYISTLLQRDIQDLKRIDDLTALPRLLNLLASRATGMLNYADISRSVEIPQTTVKRYMALLENIFVIQLLPAWAIGLAKRVVKAPKVLMGDTGLMCHLIGANLARIKYDPGMLGSLMENFVVMELRKQTTWCRSMVEMYHFRTSTGHEVDLVLEDNGGRIVGIEVKAGSRLGPNDFRGLRKLAEIAGERFHRGILLSTYPDSIPFGERLQTLPVSALWSLTGD